MIFVADENSFSRPRVLKLCQDSGRADQIFGLRVVAGSRGHGRASGADGRPSNRLKARREIVNPHFEDFSEAMHLVPPFCAADRCIDDYLASPALPLRSNVKPHMHRIYNVAFWVLSKKSAASCMDDMKLYYRSSQVNDAEPNETLEVNNGNSVYRDARIIQPGKLWKNNVRVIFIDIWK